uniref:Uncharacterized protein n=1 Tax=Chromera velia CCMP2878 TaxID=1169474 RepID=A0A0G4GJ84_9ALVE|eukprot:Cvel_22131.t1-p1 / transcript=Cvel_22131.t1 / gene=Cvel_22131 / organism=Chromera_velia_CCMP2878 / gene_product=hypothetical protein / transcript_product=hypothetical protein / location=Cvel_scaffold2145:27061-29177(+) / protein_length=392 / sequence_SO=supercontig / SO=protein_coding / is_pseudo=false
MSSKTFGVVLAVSSAVSSISVESAHEHAHAPTSAPVPFPTLPMANVWIPEDINPPVANGRDDVHGWLWLPWDVSEDTAASSPEGVSTLHGWLYHHTPEFWTDSPHDFEMMVKGRIELDSPVPGLPLPPAVAQLGTEYTFTPPSFPLDEMISGERTVYEGKFTNGSFDTEQRYLLSNGTMFVEERTLVHYLYEISNRPFPHQAYLGFPRTILPPQQQQQVGKKTSVSNLRGWWGSPAVRSASAESSSRVVSVEEQKEGLLVHLYLLHKLWSMDDFDQIVHVSVNTSTCTWMEGESVETLLSPGATLVTGLKNEVSSRLHPLNGVQQTVSLVTGKNPLSSGRLSTCTATVLEENHCVVMPDSFANCPPVQAEGAVLLQADPSKIDLEGLKEVDA